MIRGIAALDLKDGIATKQGIPWHIPKDISYFREKTIHSSILMGFRTYLEFKKPMPNRLNYVLSERGDNLREGFYLVHDLEYFFEEKQDQDVWIIGGGGLFSKSLHWVSELYLTRVQADCNCTVFFPEYRNNFDLMRSTLDEQENSFLFHFEIWQRKNLQQL